ncbi:MAG: DUF523 and DUF1722 domain-containing protein [Verrucomicrobiota bacterium]
MQNQDDRIRVGISTCLLGVNVRFDGGHKKDSFITGTLNDYFDWVPVCPEVEVGMSTPREAVRLVGPPENPKMLGTRSGRDWTRAMQRYTVPRVNALKKENLHGYILKSKSPSCGMERVKVYTEQGMPNKTSAGLFARVLLERMPWLPVEEEGRLNDPLLRENFIVRVFSHWRWSQIATSRMRIRDLVEFHAAHKFLIQAHSETHLRALGKLTAEAKSYTPAELRERYGRLFFEGLKKKATRKRHRNVLEHIAGFFKRDLDPDDRRELHDTITDYAEDVLPLIVPITLLRHHARRLKMDYIQNQVYLNPHPRQLKLLNHV